MSCLLHYRSSFPVWGMVVVRVLRESLASTQPADQVLYFRCSWMRFPKQVLAQPCDFLEVTGPRIRPKRCVASRSVLHSIFKQVTGGDDYGDFGPGLTPRGSDLCQRGSSTDLGGSLLPCYLQLEGIQTLLTALYCSPDAQRADAQSRLSDLMILHSAQHSSSFLSFHRSIP